MNIAVLSDTHGDIDDVKLFLERVRNFDVIIHLGDYVSDGEYIRKYYNGMFICVKGNCDFSINYNEDIITVINNVKFLITHGHRYNVKMSLLNLKFKALSESADIVLFGHTHQVFHEKIDNILFINPGSLSEPRCTKKKTYCIINMERNKVEYKIKEL